MTLNSKVGQLQCNFTRPSKVFVAKKERELISFSCVLVMISVCLLGKKGG